jgi:hypothetical protein
MDGRLAWAIALFVAVVLLWKLLIPFSLAIASMTGVSTGVTIPVVFVVLLIGPILVMAYIMDRL